MTLHPTGLRDWHSRYRTRDSDSRATRTQYRGAGCCIRASRSHYAGRACHIRPAGCRYAVTRCRNAVARCHYATVRCHYAGTGTHFTDVYIRFRHDDRPMRRSGSECVARGTAYRLAGSAFRCACSRSGGVGCRLFGGHTDRPADATACRRRTAFDAGARTPSAAAGIAFSAAGGRYHAVSIRP